MHRCHTARQPIRQLLLAHVCPGDGYIIIRCTTTPTLLPSLLCTRHQAPGIHKACCASSCPNLPGCTLRLPNSALDRVMLCSSHEEFHTPEKRLPTELSGENIDRLSNPRYALDPPLPRKCGIFGTYRLTNLRSRLCIRVCIIPKFRSYSWGPRETCHYII